MSTPDQETLLRAVEDARRILGEYIEPGQRDAAETVQRLLAVLDKNDVVHALDRIKQGRVLRLVDWPSAAYSGRKSGNQYLGFRRLSSVSIEASLGG
jgi:hypothetical protein